MTATSPRAQRVADQIQREIAALIQFEVNDPRVGMVSVTSVTVSRDLAYASIYITVMNTLSGYDSNEDAGAGSKPLSEKPDQLDKLEIDESIKALNRASGFLRTLLGKRMKLRIVPKLQFHYDSSVQRGQYLSSLIDNALAADQQQHSNDNNNDDENG